MSYRHEYHRKGHAIRFGYRAIGPRMLAVWDGGGIRPLDDVCGLDWVVDCLSHLRPPPVALLIRGKVGWSLTRRQPNYLWTSPLRLFEDPFDEWTGAECQFYYYLASAGLNNKKYIPGGMIDEERK